MKKVLIFLFVLSGFQARAEILSIPEDCLAKEIAPCLMKSNQTQILKSHSGGLAFGVEENTIFKIIDFKPAAQIELLQGKITLLNGGKKLVTFKLNDVQFETWRLFAEISAVRKLRVFDTRNFLLSEFELPKTKGEETVIVKAEFLAKIDMIRYLAGYFSNRKSLAGYLKSIEAQWKKEFEAQTKDQTIVLQRSVASVEKIEADQKRRIEEEARELKKVREMFFYRTFYR